MTSLPVAHAHAITSGNTTPSNDNWAVPIYYFYVINVHVCLGKHVLVKFMTFQWKIMVLVRLFASTLFMSSTYMFVWRKHVLVKLLAFQWKLMVLLWMMTYLLRVHDLYHQQSCLLGEPRIGQIAAIPMETNGLRCWLVCECMIYVINIHVCLGKHVFVKLLAFQWN